MESKIIDWKLAVKNAGGKKKLAKEIISMLAKMIPEHVKDMDAAYKQQDIQSLQFAIHKFHGGLCYTGTPKLKATIGKFETAYKNGKTDELDKLYKDILKEIDAFVVEYEKSKDTFI